MGDATTRFFEDLDRRGYEPLLAKVSGSLRFDLKDGPQATRWLLKIDRGRLKVSHEDVEADSVLGTSPEIFEELASGREHGLATLLRGDMTVTGDLRLVVQVERLFPASPQSQGPHRRVRQEVH